MRSETLMVFILGLSMAIGLDEFIVTDRPASVFVVTDRNPWLPPAPAAVELPEMEFYTFDGCAPCVPVKEDDKAGMFAGHFRLKHIDITQQNPPPGVTTVPAMRWTGADGTRWIYPDPKWAENDPRRGYQGAKRLIEMWRDTQKAKSRGPP